MPERRPSSDGWDRFPPLKTLDGTKWLCRWCRKPLDGRKTSWCSNACMREVQMRCNFTDARHQVFKRDKGVCAKCGCDTLALEEAFKSYESIWYKHLSEVQLDWVMPHDFRTVMGFSGRSPWECNHIVPLIEGGDLCDLTNLETLCVPCHKKHTAELMARLAEKKRAESD